MEPLSKSPPKGRGPPVIPAVHLDPAHRSKGSLQPRSGPLPLHELDIGEVVRLAELQVHSINDSIITLANGESFNIFLMQFSIHSLEGATAFVLTTAGSEGDKAKWWLFVLHGSSRSEVADFSHRLAAAGVICPDFREDGWQARRELGSGGFANVYQISKMRSRAHDGHLFAAMKVPKLKPFEDPLELPDDLRQELDMLVRCQGHPNIVEFLGLSLTSVLGELSWGLAIELCSGGDLFDKVMKKAYKGKEVKQIFTGILAGLDFIHSKGVVHRDIKPENIFLASPTRAVLADFGLACSIQDIASMKRRVGTIGYAAPEVIEKEPYDQMCDLFSIGGTIYFSMKRENPFGKTEEERRVRSLKGIASLRVEDWKGVPADLLDLIGGLLATKPSKRLSASQALAHRSLQEIPPASESSQLSPRAPMLPPVSRRPFIRKVDTQSEDVKRAVKLQGLDLTLLATTTDEDPPVKEVWMETRLPGEVSEALLSQARVTTLEGPENHLWPTTVPDVEVPEAFLRQISPRARRAHLSCRPATRQDPPGQGTPRVPMVTGEVPAAFKELALRHAASPRRGQSSRPATQKDPTWCPPGKETLVARMATANAFSRQISSPQAVSTRTGPRPVALQNPSPCPLDQDLHMAVVETGEGSETFSRQISAPPALSARTPGNRRPTTGQPVGGLLGQGKAPATVAGPLVLPAEGPEVAKELSLPAVSRQVTGQEGPELLAPEGWRWQQLPVGSQGQGTDPPLPQGQLANFRGRR